MNELILFLSVQSITTFSPHGEHDKHLQPHFKPENRHSGHFRYRDTQPHNVEYTKSIHPSIIQ